MIAAEGSGLICGRNPADCHGVSTESGSDRVKADSNNRDCQDYYPVATALGTDLILKLGHYSRKDTFAAARMNCGESLWFHREIVNEPLLETSLAAAPITQVNVFIETQI